MKFSRLFIKEALAGNGRNSRELAPIIRKCAVSGANKARAPEHAEDIEQELWLFLSKNTDKLDENYNIEPYLIETARNMALAYKRKFGFFGTEGEDRRSEGMAGLAGQEMSAPEEVEAAMVTSADQHAAMIGLMSQSRAFRNVINQKADRKMATTRTTHSGATKTKPAPMRPDQAMLKKLRENAGLTQLTMAQRLGLKLPTYQAYEYGRTKSVPKRVMDAVRELVIDPQYSYVAAMYGDRPMGDIAREWARRMGVAENSPAELAAALGINKSNTSRWLNPKSNVRLTVEELITYERRVAKEEKYYQNSLKRHGRNAE
jgi:transcriptional regulator with XRE-family HTH domain